MLQAQIQQPYRRESWIALLQHIFEGVDIFQQPKGWPLTTQSEKKLARSLVQFGRITLTDGKLIGFFEVMLGKMSILPAIVSAFANSSPAVSTRSVHTQCSHFLLRRAATSTDSPMRHEKARSNKDKGAYYIPKPVVQYMCQRSLIHYLRAQFPDDSEATSEIERLIRGKDPIDPRDTRSWIPRNAQRLDKLLDSAKICDPAIGSGAFPMGLLQEIYWTKLTLHPGANRAATKRAIIQHSIHGVDIDAGAVEIARLRCWLALIVDEDVPLPLPNLDYQIMQGNSLLESFEGEPLHDLDQPMRLGVRRVLGSDQHELDLKAGQVELSEEDATTANSRQNLADLRERHFACHDPVEKEQIRRKIDIAVLHALDARLDRRREEIEHSLAIRHAEEEKKKRENKRYQTSAAVEKKLAQDQSEFDSLESKRARLHALLDDPKAERPFFLWHFWFCEIFARGGFDIMIANPPYGADISEEMEPFLRSTYSLNRKFPRFFHNVHGARGQISTPWGLFKLHYSVGMGVNSVESKASSPVYNII